MPVTDLRRDTPEPTALALVPADVARENLAIPIRVDDDGLARGGGPAERRPALPAVRRQRALGAAVAGADDRHPLGHRPQLPGHRQRGQARPGLRGGGDHPEAPRRRDRGADGRLRERAGRPGGRQHLDPGRARPGLRRAHRAVAGRDLRPLPHRRRPQGRAGAPDRHGRRAGQPHQDHGGDQHRGEAPLAGRPIHHHHRREGDRRPRRHRRHHLGREVRACGFWTRTARCSA